MGIQYTIEQYKNNTKKWLVSIYHKTDTIKYNRKRKISVGVIKGTKEAAIEFGEWAADQYQQKGEKYLQQVYGDRLK